MFGALATAASASDVVSVGPAPAWVTELPVDDEWRATSATDGLSWVLADTQIRRSDTGVALYSRRVRRITSTAGLEAASQVSVTWDPGWQDLKLHAIRGCSAPFTPDGAGTVTDPTSTRWRPGRPAPPRATPTRRRG